MPSKFGFDSLYELEKLDAIVILGSVAHVTEEQPWQKELLNYVIPKIESGVPTLGICYGHQLIAHHYGCEIGFIDESHAKKEEARVVTFEKDELGFNKNDILTMAYAHAQKVHTMSNKFEHFLSSDISKYDGLKLKGLPCWCVQAHPEASERFIKVDAKVNDIVRFNKVIHDSYKFLEGFIKQL